MTLSQLSPAYDPGGNHGMHITSFYQHALLSVLFDPLLSQLGNPALNL
jgi:hypothetical protein